MSITKTLIGLDDNHIKTLGELVNKNDKRFKNKSAVIRTILECLEGDKKGGQITGIVVMRTNNCSVFDLNEKSVVKDLIKGSQKIIIEAVKDNTVSCCHKPSLEIVVNSKENHRL